MRNPPYTAVTGFMSRADVMAVAGDAYTISGFGTPIRGGRKLAIGVLVGWKTLNGGAPRQPGRYPPIGSVRAIIDAAAEDVVWSPTTTFRLKERCLRMIHYNTREPNLLAQLDRLCEIAGPNLDGFQLNMAWPDPKDMRFWRDDHPDGRIVLQVNAKMFAPFRKAPAKLAAKIREDYGDAITDILFDMSGGTGKGADLELAERVIEALYAACGEYACVGLAGGLEWAAPPVNPKEERGTSVIDLAPLFARWPDLSIDAEGRLRDPKTDALDAEKAREYVRRAAGVMPRRA